ncbi:MAG: AraC family transcriptional regulator [Cyanobacteria bacterium P01_G01_bin.67]
MKPTHEESKDSLLCSIPSEKPIPVIFENVVQSGKLGVSHASIQPSHFEEHSDPHLKIGIPLKQTAIHVKWQTEAGKQRYQFIKSGCISIVSPDLPHETWLEQPAEQLIINFSPELISQTIDDLNFKPVRIVPQWTAKDKLIEQLGLALNAEFQLGKPTKLYVESVGNLLITHLLRNHSTANAIPTLPADKLSQTKLKQTIAYIQENLEQSVTLSELATVAQLSPSRFARAFKQTTGTSPHKYILERKIEKALELLKNPLLSIAEIGYSLNFSSQSHFTTVFRRFTGTTPSVYRKNL